MKLIRIGICALVVFGVVSDLLSKIGRALYWRSGRRCSFSVGRFARTSLGRISSYSPLLLPLLCLLLIALGQWLFHLTASSYGTRMELQLLLADILLLFLAAQSFRTLEDWRGFIWFVMSFGFLVAIFGILQHLTFNGKLYWFREMRYGGIPFGPYANRNHFAGFAELIIPVSLVPLVLGKVRRERWVLVSLFAVVPIGALFLRLPRRHH